jgi:hypothetical protein
MENDKKYQEIIDGFARDKETWLKIKDVLLEDIRGHQEIINIIDNRMKELELQISKLN